MWELWELWELGELWDCVIGAPIAIITQTAHFAPSPTTQRHSKPSGYHMACHGVAHQGEDGRTHHVRQVRCKRRAHADGIPYLFTGKTGIDPVKRIVSVVGNGDRCAIIFELFIPAQQIETDTSVGVNTQK